MANHQGHSNHGHHVTPMDIYLKTFGLLIILTIATVGISRIDLGKINFLVAMIVATIKATLVVLFFMQLKYDNLLNKITIIASALMLLVFIFITASDLWFRAPVHPLKVAAVAGGGGGGADIKKLLGAGADLKPQGEKLYQTSCAMCHGATGKGDGPGGASIPPARNFTGPLSTFKFGTSIPALVKTLTLGSPGTSMPGWTHLKVEERFALAYYVQGFMSEKTEAKESDVKALEEVLAKEGGGGSGGADTTIPVDMAMAKIAEPDLVALPQSEDTSGKMGAKLYKAYCAQCHGNQGLGQTVASLGVDPIATIKTTSFRASKGPWLHSEADFIKVVSQGIPGAGKPGLSSFSKAEWSELYSYVRELAR